MRARDLFQVQDVIEATFVCAVLAVTVVALGLQYGVDLAGELSPRGRHGCWRRAWRRWSGADGRISRRVRRRCRFGSGQALDVVPVGSAQAFERYRDDRAVRLFEDRLPAAQG